MWCLKMLLSYKEHVELLGFLTLSVLYYKSNTKFRGMHLFLASRRSVSQLLRTTLSVRPKGVGITHLFT